jgi:hypothetical protein
MKFKTTSIFEKRISQLLSKEEYAQMRQALADNPKLGVLMKDTGGLRKIRWAVDNKRKSGGARIISYWHKPKEGEIYLLFAVLHEQDELTDQQKSELKKLIEREYHEPDNE